MKEAVAPLVPDYAICNCGHPEALHRKNGAFAPCQIALCECQQFSKIRTFASRPPLTEGEWAAFQEGAGFETPEETEILDRMHGITPEATVGEIADALKAHKAKPKARRKKKGEVGNPSISLVDALTASVEATAPIPCECGGKIYQLGTRKATSCKPSKPSVPT